MVIFKPNYLFTYISHLWMHNRNVVDPITGKKSIIKIFNGGGTRSSKSYDIIHFLWKVCDANKGKGLYIAVYRETLVKNKDTTLKDFQECFTKVMKLEEGKDFLLAGSGASGRPIMTVYGNTIEFKGYPEEGSEGGRADIVYFNELLENENKKVFDNICQRVEYMVLADWNPALTEHWAFHFDKEFNSFYTNTTYLDNRHLKEQQIAMWESRCPWDFADSHIEEYGHTYADDGKGGKICKGFFRKRVWDRPECGEHEMYDETKHRRPNKINADRGTIDKWWWIVYGEGQKAAQDGAVYKEVDWINEFPKTGMSEVYFGLDFGYSKDPTCLVKIGRDGMDLYIELLTYTPTPTSDIAYDLIRPKIYEEVERRRIEAEGEEFQEVDVVCDSSDVFKDKDKQFVRDLNRISERLNDNFRFCKVKKTGLVPMTSTVKRFKLHIVENNHARSEYENYLHLKDSAGNFTNMPDPGSKFCHFWDAVRYCVCKFYKWAATGEENEYSEY